MTSSMAHKPRLAHEVVQMVVASVKTARATRKVVYSARSAALESESR
jgi:hypothetical protein